MVAGPRSVKVGLVAIVPALERVNPPPVDVVLIRIGIVIGRVRPPVTDGRPVDCD
jgi:hypothetical protein